MPLACVWGEEPAGELLNWLGIPRRHQVQHRSSLEDAQSEDLDGLVLLDLPDHDSTEVEHRLIVDRLVELVDVWSGSSTRRSTPTPRCTTATSSRTRRTPR